jgi:hypothetical protein
MSKKITSVRISVSINSRSADPSPRQNDGLLIVSGGGNCSGGINGGKFVSLERVKKISFRAVYRYYNPSAINAQKWFCHCEQSEASFQFAHALTFPPSSQRNVIAV